MEPNDYKKGSLSPFLQGIAIDEFLQYGDSFTFLEQRSMANSSNISRNISASIFCFKNAMVLQLNFS